MEQIEAQNQLLDQIRNGDRDAIKSLYQDAFHYCASFVLKNKGSMEDAKELFQESLLVLMRKCQSPDFEIKHSVKAFMYTVIKNLWLKQLNQRHKGGLELTIDAPDNHLELVATDELEEKNILEQRHQQLYAGMQQLKEDCRQLIKMTFFQKLSDKEIAPMLDYSLEFVRQKRRRCIKSLQILVTPEI